MGENQLDRGAPFNKGTFALLVLAGVVLLSFMFRPLLRSIFAPSGASPVESATQAANPPAAQGEIELYRETPDGQGAPVIQAPAFEPAALPPQAEQPEAAIKLQKKKVAVNQKLVERLKKYVKDHPELDHRELEKQIKIREAAAQPPPEE